MENLKNIKRITFKSKKTRNSVESKYEQYKEYNRDGNCTKVCINDDIFYLALYGDDGKLLVERENGKDKSYNYYNDGKHVVMETVRDTAVISSILYKKEWFYDDEGKLLKEKDSDGNLRLLEYDVNGNLIEETYYTQEDEKRNRFKYYNLHNKYNDKNQIIHQERLGTDDDLDDVVITDIEYDNEGRLIKSKNSECTTLLYEYGENTVGKYEKIIEKHCGEDKEVKTKQYYKDEKLIEETCEDCDDYDIYEIVGYHYNIDSSLAAKKTIYSYGEGVNTLLKKYQYNESGQLICSTSTFKDVSGEDIEEGTSETTYEYYED